MRVFSAAIIGKPVNGGSWWACEQLEITLG
jgi:hypothetical protein